jgi:hypothetical protein
MLKLLQRMNVSFFDLNLFDDVQGYSLDEGISDEMLAQIHMPSQSLDELDQLHWGQQHCLFETVSYEILGEIELSAYSTNNTEDENVVKSSIDSSTTIFSSSVFNNCSFNIIGKLIG